MQMTPGQTKSSFFLMLHLMEQTRWFDLGWPCFRAQHFIVIIMPSLRKRTGKVYSG